MDYTSYKCKGLTVILHTFSDNTHSKVKTLTTHSSLYQPFVYILNLWLQSGIIIGRKIITSETKNRKKGERTSLVCILGVEIFFKNKKGKPPTWILLSVSEWQTYVKLHHQSAPWNKPVKHFISHKLYFFPSLQNDSPKFTHLKVSAVRWGFLTIYLWCLGGKVRSNWHLQTCYKTKRCFDGPTASFPSFLSNFSLFATVII